MAFRQLFSILLHLYRSIPHAPNESTEMEDLASGIENVQTQFASVSLSSTAGGPGAAAMG